MRLPGGGYVLHFDPSMLLGERRLDARLRPLPTFQPPMVTALPLPPFGPGFRDSQYEGIFLEPVNVGPNACSSGGWGDTPGPDAGVGPTPMKSGCGCANVDWPSVLPWLALAFAVRRRRS